MYKIKNRFPHINMTKNISLEVQETILNHEKTIEELSNENDSLKIKIKNLEEKIFLLNQKKNIYLNIIKKNNITIDDDIEYEIKNKNEGSNNLNHLEFQNKSSINEEKCFINKNTDYKITDADIEVTPKYKKMLNEYIKKEEEIKKIKEEININIQPSPPESLNSSSNITYVEEKIIEKGKSKPRKQYDKTQPILVRFPITPINISKEEYMSDPTVRELLDFIASETNCMVKYQHRIGKYLDEIKKVDIEYIINFKIKKENLSYNEKSKLKKKITRCKYLCDTYKYKLNSISFSVYNISIMTKKEWDEWLTELDKIIQNKYPPGYICDYIKNSGKNKGQICGKKDCDEH